MQNEQRRLLLLSSNLRQRYAEDILTALALPPGSMIQFRYGADYVVPTLQRLVADGTIVGATATLAFVADTDSDRAFLVPVRLATVVSAACVADIFVLKLRVGSYVDLDRYPRTADDIMKSSRDFIDHLVASNDRFYSAVTNFPDLRIQGSSDPATHWLGAARRLALHQTFECSYFVRVDAPSKQNGKNLSFDKDGRLAVVDQQSVHVPVSFYSEKYEPAAKPILFCNTDGTFVRVSSDDTYEVALRYDSVEFWLHPAALNFDSLSRITITLRGQGDNSKIVPARARFPVTIRRSRSRLVARILTSGTGALLVALPAILGVDSPLQLRIVLAVVGAALLATATVALNSPK